jgi:hypothetical protein
LLRKLRLCKLNLGAGSMVTCSDNAACDVKCTESCQVTCQPDTSCQLNCGPEDTMGMAGTECPDGRLVCGDC